MPPRGKEGPRGGQDLPLCCDRSVFLTEPCRKAGLLFLLVCEGKRNARGGPLSDRVKSFDAPRGEERGDQAVRGWSILLAHNLIPTGRQITDTDPPLFSHGKRQERKGDRLIAAAGEGLDHRGKGGRCIGVSCAFPSQEARSWAFLFPVKPEPERKKTSTPPCYLTTTTTTSSSSRRRRPPVGGCGAIT